MESFSIIFPVAKDVSEAFLRVESGGIMARSPTSYTDFAHANMKNFAK